MALSQTCISHADFSRLRLSTFVGEENVDLLQDWEYLDHVWVGEAVGFSEWLCLESRPDELGSLAIDFIDLDAPVIRDIMSVLRLPLRAGMDAGELSTLFGEPQKRQTFKADRETLTYRVGGREAFTLSCTVKHEGGLVYCTLLSHEFIDGEI